jgi:hypothetical protein
MAAAGAMLTSIFSHAADRSGLKEDRPKDRCDSAKFFEM